MHPIPIRNPFHWNGFERMISCVDTVASRPVAVARLAEEFRQGSPEAFDGIVKLMRDRVYALVRRAVRDPGQAEDIVQDAFVKAYRGLPALREAGSCERWIYQIAINLVRDHARRKARERRTLGAVAQGAREEAAAPHEEDPRLHGAILALVDGLPEHQREVFVMREVQEMSHEAIARALGIPEGTVWSRLSFARRALQESLRRLPP